MLLLHKANDVANRSTQLVCGSATTQKHAGLKLPSRASLVPNATFSRPGDVAGERCVAAFPISELSTRARLWCVYEGVPGLLWAPAESLLSSSRSDPGSTLALVVGDGARTVKTGDETDLGLSSTSISCS